MFDFTKTHLKRILNSVAWLVNLASLDAVPIRPATISDLKLERATAIMEHRKEKRNTVYNILYKNEHMHRNYLHTCSFSLRFSLLEYLPSAAAQLVPIAAPVATSQHLATMAFPSGKESSRGSEEGGMLMASRKYMKISGCYATCVREKETASGINHWYRFTGRDPGVQSCGVPRGMKHSHLKVMESMTIFHSHCC